MSSTGKNNKSKLKRSKYSIEAIIRFLKYVRFGYLFFSSIIIVAAIFGVFEIFQVLLIKNISLNTLRWLYVSRGIISSLLLMTWAAWTVYNYRGIYRDRLQKTEERFRDIIESSADAILTLDNNNIIRSWNHGAEVIFDWKKSKIIGKPITVLIPDDVLKTNELDNIRSVVQEKGYISNYETERLNNSGKRILVQLTETVIKDEKGKIVGRSQIMRDITEARMQEKQLQQSERLAAIGHMAAGVAHEVGNPLASISSLVQLVQRRTKESFTKDNLGKVREHIDRITKIVRDLVDFSRPSIARSTSTQINEVIESSVGLLKHDARCRDVNFNLDFDKKLPKITLVPDHLNQVMVNLLLNAVDAIQKSDNKTIIISTEMNTKSAIIKVQDNGPGIPKEIKGKIFEPFFTTKKVGKGTGLGLSVSHGIITRLNGQIKVKSEKGNGTTFIIELPINNPDA